MLLLVVFDFDDTLAVDTSHAGSDSARINRVLALSDNQKTQKRDVIIKLESQYRAGAEIDTTEQCPLAVDCMTDFIGALNNNLALLDHNIHIFVFSKGRYLQRSIQRFFEVAYQATPQVAEKIHVIDSRFRKDAGMSYTANKPGSIGTYIEKFNAPRQAQASASMLESTVALTKHLLPERVYFFDDNQRDIDDALSKGYLAANSRTAQCYGLIRSLAESIRNRTDLGEAEEEWDVIY